jgi:hypothetical protein
MHLHVYAFWFHSLRGVGTRSTMQVPEVNGQRDSPFLGLLFLILNPSFCLSTNDSFLLLQSIHRSISFYHLFVMPSHLPSLIPVTFFVYSTHGTSRTVSLVQQ